MSLKYDKVTIYRAHFNKDKRRTDSRALYGTLFGQRYVFVPKLDIDRVKCSHPRDSMGIIYQCFLLRIVPIQCPVVCTHWPNLSNWHCGHFVGFKHWPTGHLLPELSWSVSHSGNSDHVENVVSWLIIWGEVPPYESRWLNRPQVIMPMSDSQD